MNNGNLIIRQNSKKQYFKELEFNKDFQFNLNHKYKKDKSSKNGIDLNHADYYEDNVNKYDEPDFLEINGTIAGFGGSGK